MAMIDWLRGRRGEGRARKIFFSTLNSDFVNEENGVSELRIKLCTAGASPFHGQSGGTISKKSAKRMDDSLSG